MILNHLNLTVTDPAAASAFLAKYFELKAGGGNGGMQVVYDDNGMVLTLFKGRADQVKYPPTFHIGFLQPSEQHVNDINARLRAEGFDVPEPSWQHGSWTFYFTAPGGFMVEVGV
jgi:catechol 2,3-dioxygenase-like lactoylglutathione lyase family enzyme